MNTPQLVLKHPSTYFKKLSYAWRPLRQIEVLCQGIALSNHLSKDNYIGNTTTYLLLFIWVCNDF